MTSAPAVDRARHLVERVAFDFDFIPGAPLARATHRHRDIPVDRREMIVLDQYGRRQIHAVIQPSAARTAYFSRAPQSGVVFRVSRMCARRSAIASTYRAVIVAIPDSRCMKLSATRSADSTARVAGQKHHASLAARACRRRVLEPRHGRIQLLERLARQRQPRDHSRSPRP